MAPKLNDVQVTDIQGSDLCLEQRGYRVGDPGNCGRAFQGLRQGRLCNLPPDSPSLPVLRASSGAGAAGGTVLFPAGRNWPEPGSPVGEPDSSGLPWGRILPVSGFWRKCPDCRAVLQSGTGKDPAGFCPVSGPVSSHHCGKRRSGGKGKGAVAAPFIRLLRALAGSVWF